MKGPRPVSFKTIFNLFRQRRTHFSVAAILTLLPFGVGAIFLLITTISASGIPDVDYERIINEGELTSATITEIETQGNITVNDEHPSIISYQYANHEGERVNGIYRSLNPDKIDKMNFGDSIQVMYLNLDFGHLIKMIKTRT